MTREEARKAAEVMKAYADGKQIEFKVRGADEWRPVNELDTPLFDWNSTEYRIKPESTYRPFKNKEECWAEMQKHQPFGWLKYKSDEALTCITAIYNGIDFIRAYEKGTFADGTPFGIKEE